VTNPLDRRQRVQKDLADFRASQITSGGKYKGANFRGPQCLNLNVPIPEGDHEEAEPMAETDLQNDLFKSWETPRFSHFAFPLCRGEAYRQVNILLPLLTPLGKVAIMLSK
jgi:hypothetical protein